MSESDMKPTPRGWREIAKQAAHENDPRRVLELAHELIRVLDEESNRRMESITAVEKAKGAA